MCAFIWVSVYLCMCIKEKEHMYIILAWQIWICQIKMHIKFSHVPLYSEVKCWYGCLTYKMVMLVKLSNFITLDTSWQMHLPAGTVNAAFGSTQQLCNF